MVAGSNPVIPTKELLLQLLFFNLQTLTLSFFVYILFSEKLHKYYTGYTSDISNRLEHHNAGRNRFSKKGVPWVLVTYFPCQDINSALRLEKQIKSRGAKRFLGDRGM